MAWTCPACGRLFGRTNQPHECSPAMTLEDYFATGPPFERPIFDAVLPLLEDIADGPLHIEPVSVGIFIKHDRSWIELRPKTRWVAMSFPSAASSTTRASPAAPPPRAPRPTTSSTSASPDEVTDDLRPLLERSYLDTLR